MNSNIREELREVAKARIVLQDKLVKTHTWQTCLNCLWWHPGPPPEGSMIDARPPQCEKFKAVPPPHIIVSGCEDHENDIPF